MADTTPATICHYCKSEPGLRSRWKTVSGTWVYLCRTCVDHLTHRNSWRPDFTMNVAPPYGIPEKLADFME